MENQGGRARILSWDCANRSIAWALLDFDTRMGQKLAEQAVLVQANSAVGDILERARGLLQILRRIVKIQRNWVVLVEVGAEDIIGCNIAETDEISRTLALHRFLQSKVLQAPRVLIEHQPMKLGLAANNKSTAVAYQLAYHYAESRPQFVDPKLKNTLVMGPGLVFADFLAAEMAKVKPGAKTGVANARYRARKRHSRETFRYLVRTYGWQLKIPAKWHADVGDAVLQAIAIAKRERLI